jgi:glycosyltransferase involved in cell wall biosynthesis
MKTIFAKFNYERLPKYQIITKIQKDELGKKVSLKAPMTNAATGHIDKIYKNYKLLREKNINVAKPTLREDKLYFDFIEGVSLEVLILEAIDNKDTREVQRLIGIFLNLVESMVEKKNVFFTPCKKFNEIFGDYEIIDLQDIVGLTNIDLIFSNIIINNNEVTIIDYEWVFDFEGPKDFIIHRAFHNFKEFNGKDLNDYYEHNCLKYKKVFDKMEEEFQFHVYGNKCKHFINGSILKAKKNVLNRDFENARIATLYLDTGDGFKENEKEITSYSHDDRQIVFSLKNTIGHVKSVRIDPLELPCLVKIKDIFVNDKKINNDGIVHNGIQCDETIIFPHGDPQIMIDFGSDIKLEQVVLNYHSLNTIGYDEECYLGAIGKELNHRKLQNDQKNQELLKNKAEISEIKMQLHLRNKEFAAQENELQLRNQSINFKDNHIKNLEMLAQSMRVVNRFKRLIKNILPGFLWGLLVILKNSLRKRTREANRDVLKSVPELNDDRPGGYQYIMPSFTKKNRKEMKKMKFKPLISIIMPVYNVDLVWLRKAISSVKHQWYSNWELCIVDDASTNQNIIKYLKKINNKKIKVKFLDKNLNISNASNEALGLISPKSDYVALMDHDDELTPDALYEVVKSINECQAEFIYSDEDKLEIDGKFTEPHFKPDFSMDHLLSQNYISHFCVIKRELLDLVGGFTIGLEGAQDYDLYLRVLELTDKVIHIPKVLYHWRKVFDSTAHSFSVKSYAQDAGRKAIENAKVRMGLKGCVLNGKNAGTYRLKYEIYGNPLVSIIIPFKDRPDLLEMCIDSILKISTYQNFEIIGVSNNSKDEKIFNEMKKLQELDKRIHFHEYNEPFNYSQINNFAVAQFAKGEHLILLNNDIEIISSDWIESMLEFSQRKEVGAVGGKLYYPSGKIQHAGVIIGIGGVAGHSHKHFNKTEIGYFSRLNLVQNISAVTAACLMIKKTAYDDLGGLDEENLKVAFNDVDFCLRLREKNYLNVFTPYCEAYHHESISRGHEDSPEKKERFEREVQFMKKRHANILEKGDPFYNRNLTLEHENFDLA